MAKKEIAGVTINVNEEGYLTDSSQWSKEIAEEIAKELEIGELTNEHWRVIEFLRRDAITKKKWHKIKVATVGNPAMSIPTFIGAIPGMSAMATRMMQKKMEALDIPPIPEFIEMINDAGGKLYACKATVEMFGLSIDDFCPQVEKVLTVGEFYEISAGAEIIFT